MKVLYTSLCLAPMFFGSAFGCAAPRAEGDRGASASEAEVAPISPAELGLDKNSVFDTPNPVVAKAAGGEPGENQTTDAYFSGSPPTIPHDLDGLVPITIKDNQCLECHDNPSEIGKEVAAGDPTPIPASHYTDHRRAPNEMTDALIGARYNCTQCHARATDAENLVANTYTVPMTDSHGK